MKNFLRENNKFSKLTTRIFLWLVLAILILGVVLAVAIKGKLPKEEKIICTQEAKLCPDGSYVSRVPPKCEFAPCPQTKTVKLFYYNSEKDKDETGNIKCSRDGLEKVQKEILVTKTPIQDAIKLLLKGKENLTQEEIGRGITTEYPLEGLKLLDANLRDGILTLRFDDPLNKTGGGACRVGILWFQIEATAKQFPEVKEVRFLPEELFQP